MMEVIINNAVQVAATLLITLIGVLGAWLTGKLAKRTELGNISVAISDTIKMAQTTVLELQQCVVNQLKAAHEDGKLTADEIDDLRMMLVNGTMEKMSAPTKDLLNASGVDITAIIHGAGEAMIAKMKM